MSHWHYAKQRNAPVSDDLWLEKIRAYLSRWQSTGEAFLRPVLALIKQYQANTRASVLFDRLHEVPGFSEAIANVPFDQQVNEVLGQAWSLSRYRRTDAYDREVFRQFDLRDLQDIYSVNSYVAVINDLGDSQGWLVNNNGLRIEDARERGRLQGKILAGKDAYPVWRANYGTIKWIPRNEKHPQYNVSLDNMNAATLEQVLTEVTALRKQINGSREDQRARLRESATQARGYETHQPREQSFIENFTKSIEVSKEPTRVDRTTPVAADSTKALFIDPATGLYYDKATLTAMASNDLPRFRTLMRNNVQFLNELLKS